MQLNIHYIKRVILTEMAIVLEEASNKGDITSAIGAHGVPVAIDAAVIDGNYLTISSEQANVKQNAISLSHMLALGVFDDSGNLSSSRTNGLISWQVSGEFLELCQSKPFGGMSDFQSLGLWALLDGIYQAIRKKILTYQETFGKDLEAKVEKDPIARHAELLRSIKSLKLVTLDIQKYLAEFFKFKTADVFSLMPSANSLIFLNDGWSHIAAHPRKTVVVFPTDKSHSQRYVSVKQWENLLTRSDKALNIINLEPVTELAGSDNSIRRGFNYFIPMKDGNILLPRSFGSLTAKSSLLGVVDRIHVYKVTLSNGKILTVNHLPLTNEEDISAIQTEIVSLKHLLSTSNSEASKTKVSSNLREAESKLIKLREAQSTLSLKEHNYLHHANVRLDDSLLIHGGRGSDLLLKLAYSHTDGYALTVDDSKFELTFGQTKQTTWPENFFQQLDTNIDQPPVQVMHITSLYRDVIKLQMQVQRQRCSDEKSEAATQELDRLKQLLIRVQHYDLPEVGALCINNVDTIRDLARYLFSTYLVNKENKIFSSDITWLISLLEYSEPEFLTQIKKQKPSIACHLKALSVSDLINHTLIDSVKNKIKFDKLSGSLRMVARDLKKQTYVADTPSMTEHLLLQRILTVLQDALENYSSIISPMGESASTFENLESTRKNLQATDWLLNSNQAKEANDFIHQYKLIDSIFMKGMAGIDRLPKNAKGLREDDLWLHKLDDFTEEEINLSGCKSSALRSFIDALNTPLKQLPLIDYKERKPLVEHVQTLLQQGCLSLENMIDDIVSNKEYSEEDYEYEFQPISKQSSSLTWYVSDAITKALLGEKYKHIADRLTVEKNHVLQNQLSIFQSQLVAQAKAVEASQSKKLRAFVDEGHRQNPLLNFPILPESNFVKHIKDNAPKVIVLNTSFIQKDRNGKLSDPLLMEWLGLTNLSSSKVILLNDRLLEENLKIELRQYFSQHHINVVCLVDSCSQTLPEIRAALNNMVGEHEQAQCLCLDVKRAQEDELSALLSAVCFRQEISQDNRVIEKEEHMLLLHRLAYHYGFLAPFAEFFRGSNIHMPAFQPFGVKTTGFKDTLLVASVSIQCFVNNIRAFYQSQIKTRIGLPEGEQALVEFKQSMLQRFREYIGGGFDPAFLGLMDENNTDMAQRELMLRRFKGAIGENYHPSFYQRLQHATSKFPHECQALTPLQQKRLFRELQAQYLEQNFENDPDKQIAWVSEVFPALLQKFVRQGEVSLATKEERLNQSIAKAEKEFMLSAMRQHNVLYKKQPDLAKNNESFLFNYFRDQFMSLDRLIKRWNSLNMADVSALYYEIKYVGVLMKSYLENVSDSKHTSEIKAFHQQLRFFINLLFKRNADGISSLSHEGILERLLKNYTSMVEGIDLPNIKTQMQQWSERFIASQLIKKSNELALEVMSEIKKPQKIIEAYEKLSTSIEQFKNLVVTSQQLKLTLNFNTYIQKSDNLLALLMQLKNTEFKYFSLLKCCDNELWDDDFKVEAANFIHEILGRKLKELQDLPVDSKGFIDSLAIFKGHLKLFNQHFGRSFYEYQLAAIEARMSDKAYVPVRMMSEDSLMLTVSPAFGANLITEPNKNSSIYKAYQAFKVDFRQANYQQLTSKALDYFAHAKKQVKALEGKPSINEVVALVLVGLKMHYDPKGKAPLRNCSNIAFLLDDLMRMNALDGALNDSNTLPRLDELKVAHQMVCWQFLEQRNKFLNSPTFVNTLGFNWLTSFWESGQAQIVQQKIALQTFLNTPDDNKDYVRFRQNILKETAQTLPNLRGAGKALYGQILGDISLTDASQQEEQQEVNLGL